VSTQKQLEQDLRQARDTAENASLAKSDFLANMSHEIRTPMNGVLGTLGLLLDSSLSGTQRELAGLARASGETLLSLINDILDFSKIEAGKLSLEPIPFDLLRASEGIADMMATLAAGKGLDLILRYAPDVPRHVIGDPGRIRQVLTNLISNAIKFTDSGQVLVDVEADAVDDEAVTLRIRVEDTGPGISQSLQENVFDKFTQGDASTTRRHGGTGLGLAISSQLVELMGGTIGVESTQGQGSTFWFCVRLPLQKDAPLALLPPADLEGVRVLIVDDNAVNRRVLHEQVIGWKMRNGSCASAEDALHTLRAAHAAGDPYGIAILDYQMPVTDGAMLGRAIKDDPDLQDVSLIMLTSMGQRGDVARLKAIGFAAYLVKPARQSELLHALATVWSARINEEDPGMVTRHTLMEERTHHEAEVPNRSFNARVLLAEDHPTNQIVASMMLRNLGCTVDIAGNGREAIRMLQDAEYDVVFMDCEMPVMDGFEATAEIRLRADALSRIPIIAVTAQAMQGDRERCLRAGMDDYISKPVQTSSFAAALQHWAPTCATPAVAAVPAGAGTERAIDGTSAPTAALDADVIARLRALALATDPSLLEQIFASFQRDGAARIVALHEAAQSADAVALHTVAHAMKGASVNIGALTLADLAGQLESAGDAGRLADAAALIAELEVEFVRVASEIGAIEADVAHGDGQRA
ncbi:MAG: response regulator, partial [Pseudomonadota bacterium]|nr:response regulator [Pseudomonadota bacterium]